jgi:hypothetical protein
MQNTCNKIKLVFKHATSRHFNTDHNFGTHFTEVHFNVIIPSSTASSTDVSEEHVASNFMVKELVNQETSMKWVGRLAFNALDGVTSQKRKRFLTTQ